MYKQMIEKMPTPAQPKSEKKGEKSQETPEAKPEDIQPKKKKYTPFVFPAYKPKSEFWNFTKQQIYIDQGVQTGTRWVVYLDFVENGLLPLMKNYGYHVDVKPLQIVHNLCLMTFAFSKNQFQQIHFKHNPQSQEEDLDYYEFNLDFEVWENFWRRWSKIYDFSNDCDFGPKTRYRIPYFIWSFVNIQLSSATAQLEEELSDNENDLVETEAPKPKQEHVADDNYYSSQSKFYN